MIHLPSHGSRDGDHSRIPDALAGCEQEYYLDGPADSDRIFARSTIVAAGSSGGCA